MVSCFCEIKPAQRLIILREVGKNFIKQFYNWYARAMRKKSGLRPYCLILQIKSKQLFMFQCLQKYLKRVQLLLIMTNVYKFLYDVSISLGKWYNLALNLQIKLRKPQNKRQFKIFLFPECYSRYWMFSYLNIFSVLSR